MSQTPSNALSMLFNSSKLPQRLVLRAYDADNGLTNPDMLNVMPITVDGDFTYDTRPGRQGLVVGFSFVSEFDVESLGNDTVQRVVSELREQYKAVGMSVFMPDVDVYGVDKLADGASALQYVRTSLGFQVDEASFLGKHLVVDVGDDTFTNYTLLLERVEPSAQ